MTREPPAQVAYFHISPSEEPTLGSRLYAFFREVYDERTRSFVVSCLQDLLAGLVVLSCAAIFHFAIVFLSAVGFARSVTGILTFVDDSWAVVTVTILALIFLARLLWAAPSHIWSKG